MPVPTDTLIWYLAVFQRLFAGMEEAAATSDREAMWLYQWAADTLHNVPDLLQNYDEPSGWQSPEDITRWVLALPDLVEQRGAPPRIVRLAEQIISPTGVHEVLRLAPDLHDLDLAPEVELTKYLRSFYRFCVDSRQRWRSVDLDEASWRICEFAGRNQGIIGRVAKSLPLGLVHWHEFVPLAFRAQMEKAIAELEPWPSLDTQAVA